MRSCGHQADGVAIGLRSSELIEVDLTAKQAPRYASICAAYRRRLELGEAARGAYLGTDDAARAVRTALTAAPAGRVIAPLIGVRAVVDQRGAISNRGGEQLVSDERANLHDGERGGHGRRSRRETAAGKRCRLRDRKPDHSQVATSRNTEVSQRGGRRPRTGSTLSFESDPSRRTVFPVVCSYRQAFDHQEKSRVVGKMWADETPRTMTYRPLHTHRAPSLPGHSSALVVPLGLPHD